MKKQLRKAIVEMKKNANLYGSEVTVNTACNGGSNNKNDSNCGCMNIYRC